MTPRTTPLALITLTLAILAGCAPSSPTEDAEEDFDERDDALGYESIAALANDNIGNKACGPNSLGGTGYESSCTGNGGQPEYWCSDFARWVWKNAGADVDGLTAAAGTFYCYGQEHGTLSNTPHVGDAVVYNYQGNCWASHVALVTKVNPDGTIVTVSGNWGGQDGSQAHFSSTSSVKVNQPAYPGVVGQVSSTMGYKISGFISPAGMPKQAPPQGAEGSQAFLYPNQQHFLNSDGAGNIRHHWWDANQQAVTTNTWGTGTAGKPVTFTHGTSQHVFARGTDGSLKHWFWDPINGGRSDTWAPSGSIASDPAAIVIGDYQAVWAVDQGGQLQHWYWGPNTNGVKHDTWGSGVVGRPSVFVTKDGDQHAFARGTSGSLEHWWWSQNGGIKHDTWGNGLAGDPSALVIGDFQAVWAVDGGGALQHWYWGPNTNGVKHDTWGSGVVGRATVFVTPNGEQHAFARGTGGTLEHWWWSQNGGIKHDTWGSGIADDPTALLIGNQQHVWALDAAKNAKHWYWDPATSSIKQDNWGK
jgi:hypothetical protein